MKKKTAAAFPEDETRPCHVAAVESRVFHGLHNLVAHCAVNRYDDKDPREPGYFTVKTKGPAWIVSVKDPDSSMSFETSGQTLDDALALADLLLGSDNAPFAHDAFLADRKPKKKK